MFRWGVLSTARIAREQMLPALSDAINGVVTAVASRDHEKARALADRFGAEHAYGSYDELLRSGQVDGVYIPLPTSQHVEWTLKAAEAGKHVLCEKPIALHSSQIEPLIETRDRKKVLISEAFMVFYHPQWTKVQTLIADGAIGRLRRVSGLFTYFNKDPANMCNQVELGGGGLPDIGVYPTVTTRIATGAEPLRVQAVIEKDPDFGTDRYASVRADFGAFELDFYCATQLSLRQHMAFHGDKGMIEVTAPFNAGDYGHATVLLHNSTFTHTESFRFPGVRQYCLMAEHFARAAEGEKETVFSLEDSAKNQKVIDAAYRAGEHQGWENV